MKPYRYYACFPPFQAQLFTDQNTTRQSDAHFQARLQDIEGQIRRDQEQLYAVFKNSKTIENIIIMIKLMLKLAKSARLDNIAISDGPKMRIFVKK